MSFLLRNVLLKYIEVFSAAHMGQFLQDGENVRLTSFSGQRVELEYVLG